MLMYAGLSGKESLVVTVLSWESYPYLGYLLFYTFWGPVVQHSLGLIFSFLSDFDIRVGGRVK